MLNRFYKIATSGACASLLLATLAVTPVAAQTQPGMPTGLTPSTNLSAPSSNAGAFQNPCITTAMTTGSSEAMADTKPTDTPAMATTDAGMSADATNASNTGQGQSQAAMMATVQSPCPGTSRETAGPNFAESVQLFPGTSQWYRFRYVFDEDIDDEAQNAIVSLKMDRVGCAAFDVTTSGRLNFPFDDEGDPIGPVGRGTPFDTGDETIESNLTWVGSAENSESYFVIVRNRTNTPCNYTLSITGSPVVF